MAGRPRDVDGVQYDALGAAYIARLFVVASDRRRVLHFMINMLLAGCAGYANDWLTEEADMVEITVVYHEEDGLWWAESDQVPGRAAGGDSREEARERVREGLPFFLDGEVVIDERFQA